MTPVSDIVASPFLPLLHDRQIVRLPNGRSEQSLLSRGRTLAKRVYVLLFLLVATSAAMAQTKLWEDTFNGGVVAGGYSQGATVGGPTSGSFSVSIPVGSTIRKAYLMAGRAGAAPAVTVTLNGTPFTFDSTDQVGPSFNTNYGGASGVHAIDVTASINPATSSYTIAVPGQPNTVSDRYPEFYLVIAFNNASLTGTTAAVFCNTVDSAPSMPWTLSTTAPILNPSPVGLAIFGGYATGASDMEKVTVNGTLVGQFGGQDFNGSSMWGSMAGFQYYNNTLTGYNDDNANQAINGTDALSNIQALIPASTNSIPVVFEHASGNIDNHVWAVVLTSAGTAVAPPLPLAVAPVSSAFGDVVSGGGAPDTTGADSGADFDALKRGGFLSQSGTLVFPGNLLVGFGTPPVTLNDFQGLWKDNGTGLKLIARTGTIAPGTTTDTFNGLPNVPGISDSGDVTILGSLTVSGGTTASNDTGLWTQVGSGTTPSTFKLLAREGSVVPGTSAVVRKFASGAYATASLSATQGVVAYSVTTVGSPDKTAIYSTTVDNGVPTSSTALAIEGNPAPGVAGQTFGPLASSYSDPARMDTAGNVAFAAILRPSNKESLWYAPISTGIAAKIFFAGDVAPGTGGATFLNLKSQAIGGTGTVTFRGLLTSNTGDNTGNLKNDGIWRGTGSNVASYTCILRRGDSNATRPGLNLPNAADKVGNLWHSWLTNANHGAWLGQLDAGGDGTSVPAPGDTYGIYTDLSGTMTLYMLYGDPAPGIAGASFNNIDLPIVGGQEQMVFIGKVSGGGVTGSNDQGIWRSAPNGGALSLLIRTGDSMTTTSGTKIIAKLDFPGSGSKARQWEQPVMDSTGRVLIFVTFTDGTTSQIIAP
jgi:hypothetical protein